MPLDLHKGRLRPPVKNESLRAVEWKQFRSREIHISVVDDLILIQAQDHKVEKVFLVGQNMVWEKDFTNTHQVTEVFAKMIYNVAVPVDGLPAGRYQINIQYEGEYFTTNRWFIC